MEDGSSPTTTGKRRRAGDDAADADEETKANSVQVDDEVHVNGNGRAHEEEEKAVAPQSAAVEDGDDNGEESEEEEEEEALVVLELCDFKNHPLFDDYSSATLEGIDTATPMLRIGEYALHGQLEETVGTSYFYDTDTSKVPDKKYRFAGQTIKKIKFTIAPPEDV
ncbi:hypothetical protein PF005_g20506 [Phytophthora fragariae]|uniref:Transcription factor TFIIIC triple barrel domain-containing protein n=2 Tax=Phytophthora TaxID=4783 RepID=A0A6A3R4S3_9STRA|nr:hypothetical protein PF003_g19624 [Phytophthora fragariae]KAE9045716.1 hypothetical protein PR002_g2080 [Phytophthora rubi]KAE8929339.1 hypothetical protein PF009_g20539 [Phytophthora fragariae]KAE9050836.1 hypothetical protein PR001_g2039 [Phytophthora rubi]KAE9089702.1 hypothetical protein PF007_g19507 [Phytophthora fragariae]